MEENVSLVKHSCTDCINILEGSCLCMALWELAPGQRMNRTAEFLLWDGHLEDAPGMSTVPSSGELGRAGSAGEEMSSKEM